MNWALLGEHNVMNALAAIAAARHAGVAPEHAARSLRSFRGVKRAWKFAEVRGTSPCMTILRITPRPSRPPCADCGARVKAARLVAVLEPRSNTMKLGVHRDQLAPALALADRAWFFNPPDLGWDLPAAVAALGARASFAASVDAPWSRDWLRTAARAIRYW